MQYFSSKIFSVFEAHKNAIGPKKYNCIALYKRCMAENWLVFQCANAAEHWRPNGISIVCYLLSLHALLYSTYYPPGTSWNISSTSSSVHCCSRIGLEEQCCCVLMSPTFRPIDGRSGPTFSLRLSERHIGSSCELSQ